MRWRIGYNTNGFQSHRLFDALQVLAQIGYNSLALTLDHCHLDPLYTSAKELQKIKSFLEDHGMECVIETGGRYLLDPWKKHYPTLISPRREERVAFLKSAIQIASELDAKCVTFFSGIPETSDDLEYSFEILAQGIEELAEFASNLGVILALEPEPGMLVESITDYLYMKQITGLSSLKMTLDLGHVCCTENISISYALHNYASEIVNVHIEDIKGEVHEHLPFGEGDINFTPVFKALHNIGPAFPLHIELSRSGHNAPRMAKEAFEFLKNSLY